MTRNFIILFRIRAEIIWLLINMIFYDCPSLVFKVLHLYSLKCRNIVFYYRLCKLFKISSFSPIEKLLIDDFLEIKPTLFESLIVDKLIQWFLNLENELKSWALGLHSTLNIVYLLQNRIGQLKCIRVLSFWYTYEIQQVCGNICVKMLEFKFHFHKLVWIYILCGML